jgi:hypothetical protein
MATFGTQHEDKQNTKQHRKLKWWATQTPPKTGGEPRCWHTDPTKNWWWTKVLAQTPPKTGGEPRCWHTDPTKNWWWTKVLAQTPPKTGGEPRCWHTDPTKNWWWTQVLAKDKQFLLLIRHLPCYSYNQYLLDTTICKQTQITYLRHETSYKQLGIKTKWT